MTSRHHFAILVAILTLSSTSSAEAQTRRHPTRRGDASSCLTIPPIAPGTVARSRSISNEGVIEQVTEWVEDGLQRSTSIQKMVEPGAYRDVEATLELEVDRSGAGDLVALSTLRVRSTTRFGPEAIADSIATIAPSLVLRPVSLCADQRWTIDPATIVTTTNRNGSVETTTGATLPAEGRVVGWLTDLKVPAGVFRVLQWEGFEVVNGGIFRATTWTSIDLGVPVRQIVFGPDGALIQTTELTGIVMPDTSRRQESHLTGPARASYSRPR